MTYDTKVLVRVLCAGFTTVCQCILFVAFRANLLDSPVGWGFTLRPDDFKYGAAVKDREESNA